jgi:tight adherence protein C
VTAAATATSGPFDRIATLVLGDPISLAILLVLATAIALSWLAGRRARRQEQLQLRIETARISGIEGDRWLDRTGRAADPDDGPLPSSFLGAVLARVTPAVANLPIFGEKDREKIRHQLVIAGYRTPDAVNLMFASKILAGLVVGIAAYLWAVTGANPMATGLGGFVVFVLGLFGGALLPEAYVKARANAMRSKIGGAVPDAMDLLVICAEAGLTLDAGLHRVARELRLAAPEIAKELTITEAELRILPDRRQALENLVYRTDVSELSSLVVTLSQAEKYGTSLSQALRTIAAESRRTRMLALEERAGRLPALMGVPLMLLILPPVVVVVGGPALMRLFDALG